MTRLGPHPERILFAPLIWRLALRIEQTTWSEVVTSPAEAVMVLRSAQRLFKQDVHCAWFDTWTEIEAAGVAVSRDDLGRVTVAPTATADPPSVEATLNTAPVTTAIEVVRRLAQDGGPIMPVATMTGAATLVARLGTHHGEWVQQLMLALARGYCEAGAGALLLLEEERDLSALAKLSALFNLADYYATPVIVLARNGGASADIAAIERTGARLLAPGTASNGLLPLPPEAPAASGWLAMSRWELDPDTDPNAVHAWRQHLPAA